MELQAAFRGALSLAERPSLVKQSPGLFHNSHPAERTACKNFAHCDERPETLSLDSANPFLKGWIPKSIDRFRKD